MQFSSEDVKMILLSLKNKHFNLFQQICETMKTVNWIKIYKVLLHVIFEVELIIICTNQFKSYKIGK